MTRIFSVISIHTACWRSRRTRV